MNMTETPHTKIRAALENRYYHLSQQFLSLAGATYKAKPGDVNAQFEPALLSILFAAFCLEAFINNVCRERLGNAGEKKYLQKDSPEKEIKEKWKRVLEEITSSRGKQVTGEEFSKNPFWSHFCILFDLRDKLVHYKVGFEIPVGTEWRNAAPIYAEVNFQEAEKYVKAMDDMIRKTCELCSIDFPFDHVVVQQVEQSIGGVTRIVRPSDKGEGKKN
jgi:hypothetical protein